MATTFSQELKTFKSNVGSNISAMSSCEADITNKVSVAVSENNTAISEFDKYYKSSNSTIVLGKLNSINKYFQKLNSEMLVYMRTMISESSAILENVGKLEELEKEINEAEAQLAQERNKEEPSDSVINSLNSTISTKSAELKTLDEETMTKYNNLLALDKAVEASDIFGSGYLKLLDNLSFGTLTKKTFRASNGIKVTYLVYVPDYGEEVEGLPINMYMHGSGMGSNSMARLTESGLGRLITDKKIMPSGIVILPLAPTGRDYESKEFRSALAELPLQVADDYNADKNKISLSGHSYGSITAYRLVNEHPNEFAAIVPVSGSNKVTNAFNGVKVWAFHGTRDNNTKNTSYKQACDAMKEINSVGGDADMYSFEGWGHANDGKKGNIVVSTFTKEYERDGETMNPLEWAFRQSLNETA